MKTILAGLVVVLAGCATATVPEILNSKPFLTMELRGEPRVAAKCVIQPIDDLGWHATVRDYGDEVQVVWHLGSNNKPIAIFSATPGSAGRSKVEARTMFVLKDEEKMAATWRDKLARCQ